MTEKQEFNLNELMSQINLKDYIGEDPDLDEKLKEMEQNRKEMLRQKLRKKTHSMRHNRMSKDIRQHNQMEELKKNPAFSNIGSEEEMKKAIDMVASSMSKDSKQKKNIKKQMQGLIEKVKDNEV
jgi:hypothetical protein